MTVSPTTTGLEIIGITRTRYSIFWRNAEGKATEVYDWRQNSFRLKRDAKAALARLEASYLDWTGGVVEQIAEDRERARRTIFEALVGKTVEEAEREHEEARLRAHYVASGDASRDALEADAEAHGHSVDWKRKGQRTWWGKCSNCGAEFRSSYNSMSRSFRRTGPYHFDCSGKAS